MFDDLHQHVKFLLMRLVSLLTPFLTMFYCETIQYFIFSLVCPKLESVQVHIC